MRNINRNHQPTRQFINSTLVVAVLFSLGCDGSFVSEAKSLKIAEDYGSMTSDSKPSQQSQDCLTIGDFSQKEKCIASSDDFKDCPDSDLRCAPYRNMYAEEQRLEKANAELIALANKQYVEYTTNDHAYLDDLKKYFDESDRAWRIYRDAQCVMEPFAQGMARQESADITEACRLDETKKRISVLNELELALNENKATSSCPSKNFEEFLKEFSNSHDLQETYVTNPWKHKDPYHWTYEHVSAGDPRYPRWVISKNKTQFFDPKYRYDKISGKYFSDHNGLIAGQTWSIALANSDPLSDSYRVFEELSDFKINKVTENKYEVSFSYRPASPLLKIDTYIKKDGCWYFTQEWYQGEKELLNCKWPAGCKAAHKKLIVR